MLLLLLWFICSLIDCILHFLYSFICENHWQYDELSKYHKWCCSQTLWETHLEFLNNKKWNQSLFVQVPSVLWMQCDLGICLSKECTKVLQKRPRVMENSILLLHLTLTINSTFLSLLLVLLMDYNDEIKAFVLYFTKNCRISAWAWLYFIEDIVVSE